MAAANAINQVRPRYVVIRRGKLPGDFEQSEEFREMKRMIIHMMNVDPKSVLNGRPRVTISFSPSAGIVEFAYFYMRPAWANKALHMARKAEGMFPNCVVTMELAEQ